MKDYKNLILIWGNKMIKQKNKDQGVKQRIGKLVEEYIRQKYHLSFNKRQQTKGYYDAYTKDDIFEIKAVKAIKNQDSRIIIIKKNHNELLASSCGKYIIVNYELINKDKDLKLIQDINILQEVIISAEEITELISKYGTIYERNFKGHIKEYIRLKVSYLLEPNDDY